MEVKQRELQRGLDFAGRPLRPVRTRKLRYQSGATLDGKPLMPHRALSRTRRLLRYLVQPTQVLFYWAAGWGKILDYHRRGAVIKRKGKAVGRLPVRNVFGISPAGQREIAERAARDWKQGVKPEVQRDPIMQPTGTGIEIPVDPGQGNRRYTQADFLAMGVQTVRSRGGTYVTNTATGGGTSLGFQIKINWNEPRRRRR